MPGDIRSIASSRPPHKASRFDAMDHVRKKRGERQASWIQSTMRRSPLTDRRVVATGSEEACVSIVSVRGASRVGSVAANRVAIGISPSPTATKRRAALE